METNNNVKRVTEKLASLEKKAVEEARTKLKEAEKLAIRVEAGKVVTGFLSESVLSTIDNLLRIATPLVAISGDFELSTLLGSLKIWLDKKKAQQAAEDARRQDMMSMGYDDLSFQYSY